MAVSNGGALPVVDLAPFFAGDGANDEGARARATEAMREACQATGFFRAVNHGVPRELVARALELSAAFFALPDEEKAKVRPAEGASASPLPSGYARQPAHSADKNEYVLFFNPKLSQNEFPAEPAGFSDALEECYARLSELGVLIQDILNECMGLPRGHLAGYNADRAFDFLIALRYFPATSAEESNGLSAHEDGNCVTFVLQDGVGGLEVLGDDGRWVPAEPVEGSIVVNLGDVLQVLSNKKFKSATHRVVRTPGVHRHSLVFNLSLDGDKWVEPLPEFTGDVGEPPRYRGFRYDEYLQMRMRNKTHPPSRPEDVVHITHYEI